MIEQRPLMLSEEDAGLLEAALERYGEFCEDLPPWGKGDEELREHVRELCGRVARQFGDAANIDKPAVSATDSGCSDYDG